MYGLGGTRVVKGRGTFIFPMVETSRGLSLSLMWFDVAPKQDLYTRQGVAVTVEAVAQPCQPSNPSPLRYRFQNSETGPAPTPSVAESLTSPPGRDLIPIGCGLTY